MRWTEYLITGETNSAEVILMAVGQSQRVENNSVCDLSATPSVSEPGPWTILHLFCICLVDTLPMSIAVKPSGIFQCKHILRSLIIKLLKGCDVQQGRPHRCPPTFRLLLTRPLWDFITGRFLLSLKQTKNPPHGQMVSARIKSLLHADPPIKQCFLSSVTPSHVANRWQIGSHRTPQAVSSLGLRLYNPLHNFIEQDLKKKKKHTLASQGKVSSHLLFSVSASHRCRT